MWRYRLNDFSGRLGFGDGYINILDGVLTTPVEDLTEQQRQKLNKSFTYDAPPSLELPTLEQSVEVEPEPPKKRRRGRPRKKASSED